MRAFLMLFLVCGVAFAGDTRKIEPVDDETAEAALDAFDEAFRSRSVEERQMAVFNLHDVPHDKVRKELKKLLRNRDPKIRNVAALAMGGQGHDVEEAGELLMKSFKKDYDEEIVLPSVLEAMAELGYMGYWPKLEKCFKDERSAVVIRSLNLVGKNKDWRAFPKLVEMYQVAMPKGYKWKTGEVRVDTGTPGDADQKAAEAEFNRKYGHGGSKAKRKAQAKAKSFDERNFATHLRRTVKQLTGQDFTNSIDLEDWWIAHYVEVARKIAKLNGENPDAAAEKAKAELPALEKKIAEERAKLEKELEEQAKARRKS